MAHERRLGQIEGLLGQAILVDEEHFGEVRDQTAGMIEELDHAASSKDGHPASFYRRLAQAKRAFRRFVNSPPYLKAALDGRSLRQLGRKELLEAVAQQIISQHTPEKSAEQLVADVMSAYLRPSARQARARP